jgi:hypothetical protein
MVAFCGGGSGRVVLVSGGKVYVEIARHGSEIDCIVIPHDK